uniref:Replication initiation factor n=1 Tax=uncultured prokaryote TaxID=198431 RepID=A0A0H5QKT5_9ZZZZ|nr:hypothetical protein [uncultured prokaryote]
MQTKIDYVSFTAPSRMVFEPDDLDNAKNAHTVLADFLGDWWLPIAAGHSWQIYKAKGFYHTRLFDEDSKISVFFGGVNKHVYCEVGGQALDFIRALGSYEDFLERVATRTSRVDFAVDFESEVSVEQFIVNRQGQAFKAHSEVVTETGETRYIGSWKGERFARVYRYNDPHPRSKLLRAEVVLRGTYAKQAMAIVLKDGEVQAALAAHKPFGWQHQIWQPAEAITSEIVSKRHDKEKANTLRWLNGHVASAIINAHVGDLQSAYDWWETYVLPCLPAKQDIPTSTDDNPNSSDTNGEASRLE